MGKGKRINSRNDSLNTKRMKSNTKAVSCFSKLAILGGSPVRVDPFPKWPVFGNREEELLLKALRSGDWSFNGPFELEFADRFAKFIDAPYGFCVVNGTVSLEIALKVGGIRAGDEVIVPSLTWMATAAAVIFSNAIPVFVDVEPDTYCIDPSAIEAVITESTRAIIPVHLYGNMVDMDKIMEIAKKYALIVIEDCAHTPGSQWRGVGAGSIGDFGSFSFQQSKIITSGEGGFISTRDENYAEKIYSYKHVGYKRKGSMWNFFYKKDYENGLLRGAFIGEKDKRTLGRNLRFNEFQAAILLAQFERLKEHIVRSEENVAFLSAELSCIKGVNPMRRDPRVTRQSYYAYVFRCNGDEFLNLPSSLLRDALRAEGIPCGLVYEPVYRCSLFAPDPYDFPLLNSKARNRIDYSKIYHEVAETASTREGLAIPHQVLLGTKKDMKDIVEAVDKVKNGCALLSGIRNRKL